MFKAVSFVPGVLKNDVVCSTFAYENVEFTLTIFPCRVLASITLTLTNQNYGRSDFLLTSIKPH